MKSIREWASILLAGLSLLGYAYIEMSHNDVQNASRISALEAHQDDTKDRLNRIEGKLDKVLDWVVDTSHGR